VDLCGPGNSPERGRPGHMPLRITAPRRAQYVDEQLIGNFRELANLVPFIVDR